MSELVDFLIVGSGLTGATIARRLTDAGREVLVLDRRSHLGGNVHDEVREGGIRVHAYGPHYFRTNSEKVWQFVTRFADFYRSRQSWRALWTAPRTVAGDDGVHPSVRRGRIGRQRSPGSPPTSRRRRWR